MTKNDGLSNYEKNNLDSKNINKDLDYVITKHNLVYLETIYSGLNSKVYLLKDNSRKYTIKFFNLLNNNSKIRIEREVNGLKLLNINQIKNVPNLISFDFKKSYILTDYIIGKKITNFSSLYIDQIINFSINLSRKNIKVRGINIKDASDNFLQMQNFLRIIDEKFIEITNKNLLIGNNQNSQKLFLKYLYNEFLQKVNIYKTKSNFLEYLYFQNQIFSQSDVGIHNCLDSDGELFYLDFEHSGWDDPAKLIADWILRPNCNIKSQDCLNLIIKFSEKWHDKNLIYRIKDILPIINIKWILIRLNIGFSNKFKNSSEFLDVHNNEKIYENGKNKIDNIDRFLASYK